jgi:hypothetical protein
LAWKVEEKSAILVIKTFGEGSCNVRSRLYSSSSQKYRQNLLSPYA